MPTMPLSGTFTGTYEPFKNQLIYDPATDSTTYFEFGTYDIYTIEGEYQSLISTANPNSSKYSMISANISTLGIKATDFYFVETTGVKDTSGQALSKWTEEIYLFTSEPVKTKLDSAKVNGSDLMTSTDYDFGVFGESAWAFGVIYFGTNYGYGSSFLPSGSYKFDITGVKNLSGSSSVNINTTITVP
jgi:hypothetical protein